MPYGGKRNDRSSGPRMALLLQRIHVAHDLHADMGEDSPMTQTRPNKRMIVLRCLHDECYWNDDSVHECMIMKSVFRFQRFNLDGSCPFYDTERKK